METRPNVRVLASARVHSELCERLAHIGALTIAYAVEHGAGGGTHYRPQRTSALRKAHPATPHPLVPVRFLNQGCQTFDRPHLMVVPRLTHGRSPTSQHSRPSTDYKRAPAPIPVLQLVSPIHITTTISPTLNLLKKIQ